MARHGQKNTVTPMLWLHSLTPNFCDNKKANQNPTAGRPRAAFAHTAAATRKTRAVRSKRGTASKPAGSAATHVQRTAGARATRRFDASIESLF